MLSTNKNKNMFVCLFDHPVLSPFNFVFSTGCVNLKVCTVSYFMQIKTILDDSDKSD